MGRYCRSAWGYSVNRGDGPIVNRKCLFPQGQRSRCHQPVVMGTDVSKNIPLFFLSLKQAGEYTHTHTQTQNFTFTY